MQITESLVKCGIPIKSAWHSDEDGVFNSDNEYLRIINKARVKGIRIRRINMTKNTL